MRLGQGALYLFVDGRLCDRVGERGRRKHLTPGEIFRQ
jgi:hypothetical protein